MCIVSSCIMSLVMALHDLFHVVSHYCIESSVAVVVGVSLPFSSAPVPVIHVFIQEAKHVVREVISF